MSPYDDVAALANYAADVLRREFDKGVGDGSGGGVRSIILGLGWGWEGREAKDAGGGGMDADVPPGPEWGKGVGA